MWFIAIVLFAKTVTSECPNACSNHGKCGAYDMCSCYRNWMGSDCSQRICQFGTSHIDTPKGDLDASKGYLSSPNIKVVENSELYPYGTSEQYPQFINSDGTLQNNTAHEYAECSNKGFCDRSSATCVCFDGYSGSSCSRLACPYNLNTGVECSGHGVCSTARELAQSDFNNLYSLWDATATMGCDCDPGYSGPSCEARMCKLGFDPIYWDEDNSHRYSNWSFVIHTQSASAAIQGNYSIGFSDYAGQRWATQAISATADCLEITTALESIPNDVILEGSVECLQFPHYHSLSASQEAIQLTTSQTRYGTKTILAFPSNPGVLRQPTVNFHLDGPRPTLFSNESIRSTLGVFIYPDGFHGEETDFFSTKCLGIEVGISKHVSSTLAPTAEGYVYHFLSNLTPLEARLLARCLGDGDGNEDTFSAAGRVQGANYTWDYGDRANPHMVKLVDSTERPVTRVCNSSVYTTVNEDWNMEGNNSCRYSQHKAPGFFVSLFYDPSDALFKLFSKPGLDYSPNTLFNVFTTAATLQLVSDFSRVYTSHDQPYSNVIYTTNDTSAFNRTNSDVTFSPRYNGNVDCETNGVNANGALDCAEKEDRVVVFDPSLNLQAFISNPKYLNMYTLKQVTRLPPSQVLSTLSSGHNQYTLDMSLNAQYLLTDGSNARMYLFRPPSPEQMQDENSPSLFRYVSPCANRGLCDDSTGQCNCFLGFAGDNCAVQNNIIS